MNEEKKWKNKQIIDLVSKGINSVILKAEENKIPSISALQKFAYELTTLYLNVFEKLEEPPTPVVIKTEKGYRAASDLEDEEKEEIMQREEANEVPF
jgi:uncharacterized protein YjhX (UPF0386 family)